MNRRKFCRNTAATGMAVPLVGLPSTFHISSKTTTRITPDEMFIGTMLIPHDIIRDGIEESLDKMTDMAAINTVMPFSHTHVGRQYRKDFAPFTDEEGNPLTDVYYQTNPKFYKDPLQQGKAPGTKYDDIDFLRQLIEASQSRGIDVYARILEPYRITGAIAGFEDYAEINVLGEKGPNVCYNHPDYIAYWDAVIDDLIHSNPGLKGFKFGQERGGPLQNSLNPEPVTCFCSHCTKLVKERGIDQTQARQGFMALSNYATAIRDGNNPADGNLATFFRILSEYPAILAYERFMKDSREQQRARMYSRIKGIREEVQVGWHIDHSMGWALGMKAFWPYDSMMGHSDWLSIALYFDSIGPRSYRHYKKYYRDILFGDADPSISYPMYMSMIGLDPSEEPTLEEQESGCAEFSPHYVYREADRAVRNVNGRAKVYGRIGFDMPSYRDCDIKPDQVYAGTMKMFEAKVDGVFCGREWEELQDENIAAFGNAVRDFWKSK